MKNTEKEYITSIYKGNVEYEGQRINALSWEDAERQAAKQGVIWVGELA